MMQIIKTLNEYLRGWGNYFKIQEYADAFEKLDKRIRMRLRSMQLKKWKKPRRFQTMLIKAGLNIDEAKNTWVKMGVWRSARRWVVQYVMNLEWFRNMGLVSLNDFTMDAHKSQV